MDKRQERHLLEDRARAAAQELAAQILPQLSPDDLERARAWTGLDFLQPRLLETMAGERGQLENQLLELERDPQFKPDRRSWQEQADAEKQRLQGHQSALMPLLRTCISHPRFSHLVRVGYGTPEYGFPFWRLSYYRDREAAQELCQQAGHRNFTSLLDDYRSAKQAYEVLAQKLESLGDPGRTPYLAWCQAKQRLAGLQQIHLTTAQTRITLALLKGGEIWERLERAKMPTSLLNLYLRARSLSDQVDTERTSLLSRPAP